MYFFTIFTFIFFAYPQLSTPSSRAHFWLVTQNQNSKEREIFCWRWHSENTFFLDDWRPHSDSILLHNVAKASQLLWWKGKVFCSLSHCLSLFRADETLSFSVRLLHRTKLESGESELSSWALTRWAFENVLSLTVFSNLNFTGKCRYDSRITGKTRIFWTIEHRVYIFF